MFGFFKRTRPVEPPPTPRAVAIQLARLVLEDGVRYLTCALAEVGIERPRLLAGEGPPPAPWRSSMLDRALTFDEAGRRCVLLLGKTLDFETYNLEPHYRYREIHLLIEDLERLASGNVEARHRLIRQHAAHALLQSGLLRYFLARDAVVEALRAANDMKAIEQETQNLAKVIIGLTTDLPAPFERGLDLPAIRKEWVGWPHITVEPVNGKAG